MAQAGLLASTVLMGVLTAGVVMLLARGRGWRHYTPTDLPARRDDVTPVIDRPGLMATGFIAAVFVVGGAVVLLAGGLATIGTAAPSIDMAVAVSALLALLIAGYAFAGSYSTARSHGAGNAQALLVGLWALGLLFVLAIAAKLFVA
ncbi:MAG: hypothetical protein ABEJ05_08530 [Haloglomus sp.]